MLTVSVFVDLDDDFVTLNNHPYLKFHFACEHSIESIKTSIIEKIEEHLLPENLIKNNDEHKKNIIIDSIQRKFNERDDINLEGDEISFGAGNYDIVINIEQPKPKINKRKKQRF